MKPSTPELLPNVYANAPSKVTISNNYIDFPIVPTPAGSEGRFWFEPDVNGNISNPAYDQDNANERVLRPEIPCSYYVFADSTDGNVIKAKNGLTGSTKDVAASTNLDAVVNALLALSTFSNGGMIHLAGNTTFDLNSPIIFNNASNSAPYYSKWILEGEGQSSIIQQNTSGTDAIQLSNAVNVGLRNLRIATGPSAGRGLYASNTGASEVGWSEGTCEDVIFEGSPNGARGSYPYVVELINPWFVHMDNVRIIGAPTKALFAIVNNSTSTNYGNSKFNLLKTQLKPNSTIGAHALYISGTSGQTSIINLNTFTEFGAFTTISTVTGSHGIHLDQGACFNWFYGVDVENWGVAVYINGASGHVTTGNVIVGGYLSTKSTGTSAIATNAYTLGNYIRAVNCYGLSSGVMINEGSTSANGFNSYADILLGNSTTTVTVGQGVFTGYAGQKFFSNQGISTQNGNGSNKVFTINHNLVTRTSGTPRYSMVMVNANLGPYTWTISGTQITVTFVTAPPTGTGNVIMNWSAGI
jgi:hypothetical protein